MNVGDTALARLLDNIRVESCAFAHNEADLDTAKRLVVTTERLVDAVKNRAAPKDGPA